MRLPLSVLFPVLAMLAPSLCAQRLIAVDNAGVLYRLDPLTGAKTPVATVSANAGTTAGLAYDAAAGTMFATSTSTDSLYTIDLVTGAATLVGAYGDPALLMHGLELDGTGRLFGCSTHDGGLYAISRTTGTATLVGPTGLAGTTNLAWDGARGVMFATNTFTDSLYRIDLLTGTATLVGPLGASTGPNGAAVDPATGAMYLVDNGNDSLFTVDVARGTALPIGSTGEGNLLGLAWLPGGSGSVVRTVHGCGPTTIHCAGTTVRGGTLTTDLGNTVGLPFVGIGLTVGATPFCSCTIGHDWLVAQAGSHYVIVLPVHPSFAGMQFALQGADVLGPGGCPDPLLTLTDSLVVTIG
jgi:sugar lactone lactonase YvrE